MVIFTAQRVCIFLAVTTFVCLGQARSLREQSSHGRTRKSRLLQPREETTEACYGMSRDECEKTKIKYNELKEILLEQIEGHKVNIPDSKDPMAGDCMLLTAQQLDILIDEAKQSQDKSAMKREKKALYKLVEKWSLPIHYTFDGTHDENQKTIVRNSFQHWMDNTCVRFRELETNASFDGQYVRIERDQKGCFAYPGYVGMIPQPLNLADQCFYSLGTPVHEIGHTLGLMHEQNREDRDRFIIINNASALVSDYISQYVKANSEEFGLAYDYGSVMHYQSRYSEKDIHGMVALQPMYQMNIGQRNGLSFHDRKVINLAYCQDTCPTPLSQPCLRGGYQNPNKCSTCICPDGFSGQYCNEVAPAERATCGGELIIEPGTQQVIKSPGYDETGYSAHQACSWWIKAPKQYRLQLTFDGDFNIFCDGDQVCRHWVEVKYKRDLGLEGGRFCCDTQPNVTVVSESNEMMVIFQSNSSSDDHRGFKAIVQLYSCNGIIPTRESLLQCCFDNKPNLDRFCGIRLGLEPGSKVQWELIKLTDTQQTQTYIFLRDEELQPLETDRAWLIFPDFNFDGVVCFDFDFYILGPRNSSITLNIIDQPDGRTQEEFVWPLSPEETWQHGSVDLTISSTSTISLLTTIGFGSFGGVGVDNIQVSPGPCA